LLRHRGKLRSDPWPVYNLQNQISNRKFEI
jgi:hypothetical protein